jgi:hypothetical protein
MLVSIVSIFIENKPIYLIYESGVLLYTCVNLDMLSACLHEYLLRDKFLKLGLG